MKRKPATKKKTAVLREQVPRVGISLTSGETNSARPLEQGFREVLALIERARERAYQAANTELIDLYWGVGERISQRIASDGWGKSTIVSLAAYIHRHDSNARGFSAQNLWRMRQFYETWRGEKKLSPLVRELTWTNNLLIMGKCKRSEEREFYPRLAAREHWAKRQLERQIDSALFERIALSPAKLSPAVRVLHPQAAELFKDSYLVEFLHLSGGHSEEDLHRGLLQYLRDFLIELGRDFCFVGSEYPIQVGGQDFSLDLLFFNRALNCLVAFDLKITRFEPEHLGKMEFY
ncbi:MAG TPA: PDDEXK nuclease domain-containing protein, partial [Dongiaceae bacterium]|nr:PDDEXK nuclease domain-containing protein [Dongiaceae bacterium]